MDFATEAERGRAPLPGRLRLWGFWEYTWANSALAIATWGFLIGGSLSGIVGVKDGLIAIVLGNVIGVVLVSLAVCVSSGKYGVEQYTFLRSCFGPRGSRVVYLLAMVLLTVGWLVVLGTMFGRAIDAAIAVTTAREPNPHAPWIAIITILAIAITAVIVAKGPTSVKVFNTIVAPALFVVMGIMVFLFLRDSTPAQLLALPPINPPDLSHATLFMIAVEINIAAGFSWWPYIGNLARITKNERVAFWPNLIGICVAACIGEAVGLVGALKFGFADPTMWMANAGGVVLAVIILLFVAFANVTSMANILFTAITGMRQAFIKQFKSWGWDKLVYAFCIIPVIALFAVPGLYDGFITFMVWSSALYAALSGVMIVDYFFFRRTHVALDDLFDSTPASRYYFWRGVNPAGVIAVLLGFAASALVFNPQTLSTAGVFTITTASLCAVVVAAVIYAALTPLTSLRKGWGGYPAVRGLPAEAVAAASIPRS